MGPSQAISFNIGFDILAIKDKRLRDQVTRLHNLTVSCHSLSSQNLILGLFAGYMFMVLLWIFLIQKFGVPFHVSLVTLLSLPAVIAILVAIKAMPKIRRGRERAERLYWILVDCRGYGPAETVLHRIYAENRL